MDLKPFSNTHARDWADKLGEQPMYQLLQELRAARTALLPPDLGPIPDERAGAYRLRATQQNADYWLRGGRACDDRDHAVMAVENSANAWKNAAYAFAEKLQKTEDALRQIERLSQTTNRNTANIASMLGDITHKTLS